MTVTSQQHEAELHKKLWDMANNLRSHLEAAEFKNYILGIIFFRFLSEKVEDQASQLLKNDEGQTYLSFWNEQDEEGQQDIIDYFVDSLGYSIKPEHLFSTLVAKIQDGTFSVTDLQEAVTAINNSTVGSETQEAFDNLFEDLDLNSSKLGKTVSDRTRLIGKILQHVGGIPFKHDDVELDVLGSAYEYLLNLFASSAGKSAGEFYTPQQVSKILAKIVAGDKKQLKSAYDPTCGSGSLLLRLARETKVLHYYGQELTPSTYNLARMNMMLHGVKPQDFDIKNDDTLTKPQHLGKTFEAIVANPPYSAHWNPSVEAADDVRFSEYGKLAPKTKADFAFVQHMMYHLDDNGTMAVVLPHGVLFRGGAEGVIRKHIIEKNYLDTVIGLPANIFYGTSIPTCILVFKKCREVDDKVLFIDASNEFEKGKNSNSLRDTDVDTIFKTYNSRTVTDKFSREVELQEIKENDYNLNIPRYVDSSEEEDTVDLYEIRSLLEKNSTETLQIDSRVEEFRKNLRELTPVGMYIRSLYESILETAPTLESVAFVYSGHSANIGGFNLMTHDGKNVESEMHEDYPVQTHALRKKASELVRRLGVGSFALRILKDGSATLYSDPHLERVVWDSLTSKGMENKTLDERWQILVSVMKEPLQFTAISKG